MQIKNKLLNFLNLKGKKKTSENLLLKSIKELQKISTKKTLKLVQLSLINTTPLFKLAIVKDKKKKKKKRKIKKIPIFLSSYKARTAAAIKFLVEISKKNKNNNLSKQLSEDILKNCQNNKSFAIETKNNLQSEVIKNKKYFKFYKIK